MFKGIGQRPSYDAPKPPLPEPKKNMPASIKSSTRYEVNGFMNGYLPDRMEPMGPNRKPDMDQITSKVCNENPSVETVFRLLQKHYGFSNERIADIAKKVNEVEQI